MAVLAVQRAGLTAWGVPVVVAVRPAVEVDRHDRAVDLDDVRDARQPWVLPVPRLEPHADAYRGRAWLARISLAPAAAVSDAPPQRVADSGLLGGFDHLGARSVDGHVGILRDRRENADQLGCRLGQHNDER